MRCDRPAIAPHQVIAGLSASGAVSAVDVVITGQIFCAATAAHMAYHIVGAATARLTGRIVPAATATHVTYNIVGPSSAGVTWRVIPAAATRLTG